jgi:hypothetical protein
MQTSRQPEGKSPLIALGLGLKSEGKDMQKLNRKQIREGLSQVPIDTVLLGTQAKDRTLTHKQKLFARSVAMGETKAQSYRNAYNSKTSRAKTQGDAGSRLAKHSGISAEIEAYSAAIEASKYRTPAQLREFVIHQLTLHAMNDDNPPAQRIKSLELLGKVSEVAAFTERKETTIVNQSSDIKQRLLFMLSNTIDITPNDLSSRSDSSADGDSLLAEIKGYAHEEDQGAAPTHAPPPDMAHAAADSNIHTIPHKQSTPKYISSQQPIDNIEEYIPTLTSYSAKSNIEGGVIDEKVIKEGVGVVENVEIGVDVEIEKVPPLSFRAK